METTQVLIPDGVNGEIQLFSDGQQAGEMNFSLSGKKLRVFHTEVYEEYNGRGLAKLLLDKLIDYALENDYRIIPLCPYVLSQFKRHPEAYSRLWLKDAE